VKRFLLLLATLGLMSCQTPPEGVANKVMADFGLRERPEGHVSGSDQVYTKLQDIGATELKRLNARNRHGEMKYEGEGLQGQFYKEVKVYEDFHPLDVRAFSGTMGRDRGYHGFIQYSYRMHQSPRKTTRVEAQAETASIPVGTSERETYRYTFGPTGVWNGAEGERSK
jgi:hypothetical protein